MKNIYNNSDTKNSTETMIIIRPYNLQELSFMYQISKRTLNRWIQLENDKIGKRNGRIYTAAQVEKIFSLFGLPYSVKN